MKENAELRNLYFERSNGEQVLLLKSCSEEEAFKKMQEFCNEHNFKIYYVRSWSSGNEKHFDVGSHTEFFIWK